MGGALDVTDSVTLDGWEGDFIRGFTVLDVFVSPEFSV